MFGAQTQFVQFSGLAPARMMAAPSLQQNAAPGRPGMYTDI